VNGKLTTATTRSLGGSGANELHECLAKQLVIEAFRDHPYATCRTRRSLEFFTVGARVQDRNDAAHIHAVSNHARQITTADLRQIQIDEHDIGSRRNYPTNRADSGVPDENRVTHAVQSIPRHLGRDWIVVDY
jgi:hypothetical protein